MDKLKAKQKLNLSGSKPVLAILGGSQGSAALNHHYKHNYINYTKSDIEIIWQCGKNEIDTLQQYIGGGILSHLANPTLHYNKIQNNGNLGNIIKTGSGIYASSSSDGIDFIDRNNSILISEEAKPALASICI